MERNVYVAYGFHVNCYHSYRGDTFDRRGFGSDIEIIRKTIETFNDFNSMGVPAKATWDYDNAYSLEKILPRYAPDILEKIRDRCERYGDENIIMGYNNGALSAMNDEELTASINRAITNEKGSGLLDVFGSYQPVVRPQEVMFTPSQVSVYNKLGIKALCLYYSCVPFDAFRSFIPELPDVYAFNPLNYVYKGEKLTVMPTYNNADIIDAGSLRYLCGSLHRKQVEGEIDGDVLIFINMDADAVFWKSLVPKALNFIPNADGIHGLIKEAADLSYVKFTTVGAYLNTHEPLCDVSFTEDTADGGFSGYSSWAEKPFNAKIWTRLERARAYAKLSKSDGDSPSFDDRIMLLSTTHFGLASPVLNIQRERKALSYSESAYHAELDAVKKTKNFTVKNISGSDIVSVQLSLADGFIEDISKFKISGAGASAFVADGVERYESGCVKTVFAVIKFKSARKSETLRFSNDGEYAPTDDKLELTTENLTMKFCRHGKILSLKYKDRFIAGDDFLRSYITYDRADYPFKPQKIEKLSVAGSGRGFKVSGLIDLPAQLDGGNYEFDFYTLDGVDCIFTNAKIKYPYTFEDHEISTESTALGRKMDIKWTQVAPFSLTPAFSRDISIVKRNYENDVSSYEVGDFGRVLPENKNLDSFNNHLTNGFIGVGDKRTTLLLANAKQVLNSMAYCPMRLRTENDRQKITMNPFGTFYGKQRKYVTRSNGSAAEAFTVVSPQSRSLAPAYNGAEVFFSFAFLCYDGLYPDEKILNCVNGFSEGCAAVDGQSDDVAVFRGDNVKFKDVSEVKTDDNKLKSVILSGADAGNYLNMAKIALKVAKTLAVAKIKSLRG